MTQEEFIKYLDKNYKRKTITVSKTDFGRIEWSGKYKEYDILITLPYSLGRGLDNLTFIITMYQGIWEKKRELGWDDLLTENGNKLSRILWEMRIEFGKQLIYIYYE